jgi:multidrug efflux system outer membrane protein
MQLEIAKRTFLAWEGLVKISQARLRHGLINKLNVDQFEAERENAAARIAELNRHMIQKENELSAAL